MKAYLKNYRQSPRKVRLVADFVRGKEVNRALAELNFLPKRASAAIAKLIKSAAANAEHNFKVSIDSLIVKEIRVDQGVTMKRFRPRSRGMAHKINKRTSNVIITLGQKGTATADMQVAAAPAKAEKPKKTTKETKKPAAKKVEKTEKKETTKKKPAAKKTTAKKTAAKKTTKRKKITNQLLTRI